MTRFLTILCAVALLLPGCKATQGVVVETHEKAKVINHTELVPVVATFKVPEMVIEKTVKDSSSHLETDFAESDARAFANVLSQMGGVPKQNVYRVTEPSVATLQSQLESLDKKLAAAKSAKGADANSREEVLEMAGLSPSHIKKAVKECSSYSLA